MSMAAPPRRRTSLPYELVEEILLRLPPDDPACLLRISFACKAWGRAVSQPDFRGRFIKEHQHRPPPLIGFLHNWEDERVPRFLSTTASPFSLPAPDRASWLALDCRHGRALFLSEGSGAQQLLVWDLSTGIRRRIPVPPLHSSCVSSTAAVLCPADGCDHRDCNGGPFRVVFVFTEFRKLILHSGLASVCVYSSETGTWSGELGKIGHQFRALIFTFHSSLLVGRSLLYFMSDGGFILEYDLASNVLTGFETPYMYNGSRQIFNLMVMEDGGIGVSEGFSSHLKLWSREESDAQWLLSRVIHLENLLPPAALVDAEAELMVLGFAEGVNVIFVDTVDGLFTIELQSERVKKVCDDHGFRNLIPVVSFYTPVDRLKYQDLLPSIPSEDVGDEEGGEEEKTVDEAQQLLDKGSNTIKEGGFVDTVERVSHDLNASEQSQVNDSLDDVSRSASNEESVKDTASEDDAKDSKTSGSNGEDAAPSLEKGDS